MPTVSEALAIALQFHRAGQLQQAEQIYRQVIEVQPDHAPAYNQLGDVLIDQGKLDAAVACYGRALELKPDFAGAHNNLGNALKQQGKLDEAVACYRRALQLQPVSAVAHNNLGAALRNQGKLEDAIDCYRRAIALQPAFAEAHSNLGEVIHEQGALQQAADCYRRALELKPQWVAAAHGLGDVLKAQGRLDEAVACYRRALELQPASAVTLNGLGNALRELERTQEAIACYRRALEMQPTFAEAHHNWGLALKEAGELEPALACFRRALELRPDYAHAHTNHAMALLLAGDWRQGWPEYEWRWQCKGVAPRHFPQPLWDGSPLRGKTILIHAEQGIGDTFQFVRYVPLVEQSGATVLLECEKALLPLLGELGNHRLIGRRDPLPAFDTHAPLLSLPRIFQTTLDTVPVHIPYLHASPPLVEHWREKLREIRGYKIGINWESRPANGHWRLRDIPLRQFAGVAEIPGVRLISLQGGTARQQRAQECESFPVIDLGGDVDQAHGAFMDTAAILPHLELVITSDTALAHLAGAMGVPVWVALPFAPDWRWMLGRSDSPWYPTMRLFRQPTSRDWESVFDAIQAALRDRLQAGRPGPDSTAERP